MATAGPVPPLDMTRGFRDLQGSWTCDGRFERSGKPISAALTFSWNAASSALVVHHDDQNGGAYHSLEVWAPPGRQVGWRAAVVDAYSGMRRYASEGWRDGALAWTREDDPGARVERFTYRLTAPDRLSVVWETGPAADAWEVGDRLACTRARTGA